MADLIWVSSASRPTRNGEAGPMLLTAGVPDDHALIITSIRVSGRSRPLPAVEPGPGLPVQSCDPSEGKISVRNVAVTSGPERKTWSVIGATLPQDVKNDAIYGRTKLTMPVLAIGASASLGSLEATQVHQYATDVTGVVIPDSGPMPGT
jgi:hypothetical protein